jgi:hypothetical protein
LASNTLRNVGIRRECGTLGMRNFEGNVDPTVAYKANKEPLEFMGTTYHAGTTLGYDYGSPPSSYSPEAVKLLELYWNQGWILPVA